MGSRRRCALSASRARVMSFSLASSALRAASHSSWEAMRGRFVLMSFETALRRKSHRYERTRPSPHHHGLGHTRSERRVSLTVGPQGPTVLHDHYTVQKIQHFNRERVPERVVHAKGSGAHGFFEVTNDVTEYLAAAREEVFAHANHA